MKFDPGQKRIYALALIVLASAIAILCIWFLWLKDDGEEPVLPESSRQPTKAVISFKIAEIPRVLL